MEKRQVLRLMIMLLYLCNTLVTININVAIISMARPFQETELDSHPVKTAICPNTTFFWTQVEDEKTVLHEEDTLIWSNYEKRMVLSAYHWLSWLSILPGSVLAQKYGSKTVVGYMLCTSSVMSSIIPLAAQFGAHIVMFIRMVQGFFSFIAVPAGIYTIIGNWSSEGDRGRFMSMFLVGTTLGFGVGGYTFGYIGQYLHWKYIFYLTSVCGIVWTVFWYFLICDYPHHHPTISIEEKTKILKSKTRSSREEKIPIPWRDILTSIPVIVFSLTYIACMFNFVVSVTFIPLYLQDVYGMDSNKAGILVSLPQILSGLSTIGLAWLSDYLIQKKWLSLTGTRKFFLSSCLLLISLPFIPMAFIKCDLKLIIILLVICTVSNSLNVSGIFPIIVDMSPKFCGVLEGKVGTETEIITLALETGISYLSQFLSVEVFWKVVFLTTATFGLLAAIPFIIWGSAEVQPWNEGSKKYRQKNNHEDNISSLKLLNVNPILRS